MSTNTEGPAVGTWICRCPNGNYTRSGASCRGCGMLRPCDAASTATPVECVTCWNTGFYHGHGAPCTEGCLPPKAKVGLHVELLEAKSARDYIVDVLVKAFDGPRRGGPAVALGDHVRVTNNDHGGYGEGPVVALGPDTPAGTSPPAGRRGPHTFWIDTDNWGVTPCDPDWNIHWEIIT